MALPAEIDFVKNPEASPARMNTAMAALDARLRALELPAKTIDDVLATIQQTGLVRINDALQPYYQGLADLVTKYTALTAAPVVEGGTIDAASTRIKLRRSTTAGDAPTDLEPGEMAINQTDALLYWLDHLSVTKATPLLTNPAALDSPVFTGLPRVPTVSPGDSSTLIANTAFVAAATAAAIAALVNSAPTTLDTLKELADALGDDANYAATVTAALANRLRFDAAQTLSPTQLLQVYSNLNKDDVGGISWHAASTPPLGKLKANGAAVSRTTYANLFARIGTTFGAGDGSTTFNLPDLRGAFIRGWDNGRGLDSTANRAFGSYQADQFQSHNHSASASTSVWPSSNGGWSFMCYTGAGNGNCGYNTTTYTMAGSGATASTSVSTGLSGGAETNPKNYALLPCIQY